MQNRVSSVPPHGSLPATVTIAMPFAIASTASSIVNITITISAALSSLVLMINMPIITVVVAAVGCQWCVDNA